MDAETQFSILLICLALLGVFVVLLALSGVIRLVAMVRRWWKRRK